MSNPNDAEIIEWDDDLQESGNTAHLAEHRITPEEAEEVFYNGGKLIPNTKGTGDYYLVGRTNGGRALTLVLAYDEVRRCIRIFTGWDSTDGEKTRYQ